MDLNQLESVLLEFNAELNTDVMLCPEFSQGLSTAAVNGIGYKLCSKRDMRRKLFLILDQHSSDSFDIREAKAQIRSAILRFLDSENTDRTMTATIIY